MHLQFVGMSSHTATRPPADHLARAWGKRIEEQRIQLGMSQVEAAARVGTDQSSWSKWERGVFRPSDLYRPRIARVLRIPVAQLFDYPAELVDLGPAAD